MSFTQAIRSVLIENYANFKGRAALSEFWWFTFFIVLMSLLFYVLFLIGGGNDWLMSVYQSVFYGDFVMPMPSGFLMFIAVVSAVFWFAILIPVLAVSTRRYHDAGFSGWWLVVIIVGRVLSLLFSFPTNMILITIFGVAYVILAVMPGQKGENKYGANPKKALKNL